VIRHKMLDVCFLSEMKMRRECVFKKVNDKISDEHEEIREVSRHRHGFGQDFQKRRGQHESRTEREKIFQILARPFAMKDKKSAKNIRRRCCQSKQQRQKHAGSGNVDGWSGEHRFFGGLPF